MLPRTEFALKLQRELIERGVPPTHPFLAGRYSRRVADLIEDGRIPAQRIRGRWYVDESIVPQVAEMLGVVPKAA
jgi:hypothetical protein